MHLQTFAETQNPVSRLVATQNFECGLGEKKQEIPLQVFVETHKASQSHNRGLRTEKSACGLRYML